NQKFWFGLVLVRHFVFVVSRKPCTSFDGRAFYLWWRFCRRWIFTPFPFCYNPCYICDSDRIRTCDLLIRSQLLYPAELRSHILIWRPKSIKLPVNLVLFGPTICITASFKSSIHIEQPTVRVQIEPSWANVLEDEFGKPYFHNLVQFLRTEKENKKIIFPKGSQIFNAFNTTPFDKTKIVILGQDPYHGPGQAMGLSFSVPKNCRIPPSLRNIFKELQRSENISMPGHGDLTAWARQGVFLLNAILTVEKGKPGSHARAGWAEFTDAVIQKLSSDREGIVFMLWGNF